jgi:hypothetical protein
MPGLDIFDNDAFSLTSLTASINRMPYVPQKIASLGIFEEDGVYTDSIYIEEYDGVLSLVPAQRRGEPPVQNAHARRKAHPFRIYRRAIEDAIYADEIANVRAFGEESELETVQGVADLRFMEMKGKQDATTEYGRVNALKGILLDADGQTPLYNLFTIFGITQTTTDLLLGSVNSGGTANTTPILDSTETILDNIENELGMMTSGAIIGILGATMWGKFITSPDVRTAYQYFQASNQKPNYDPLRNDMRYVGFEYGGITWYKYRGYVGGIPYVADNEGYVFPTGVPGLFITRFAPGDWIDTVNTKGLPYYAKIYPTLDNKSRKLETQSNALSLCTRPAVLQKVISST